MVLIFTKMIMAIMIGFGFSIIIGFLIIPFLTKIKANQSESIYLRDSHKNKEGTPTLGGLIFIFSTLIVICIFLYLGKIEMSHTLAIILFTFISYGLIGFIDDFLIIKRKNNKGLAVSQKLIFQIIVAIIFFYLFLRGDNEPLLWIHSLNFKWDIGFWYGFFILFVLLASSNAVNLTDGLDGLAGGLCFIAFIVFGILSIRADWLYAYEDISLCAFVIAGSILGFLFFNTHPAKIFMGDTGSLALGATLGAYAIMTRHELLLLLIGVVFAIETLSCILQIVYYKLTKKRLFPMTPIHHTLEKKGFNESDIVKIFWSLGLFAAMISLIYGVWL